jgi:hypothetical protein
MNSHPEKNPLFRSWSDFSGAAVDVGASRRSPFLLLCLLNHCRRYSLSLFLGICHFEAARWGVFVLKLHLLQADRKPLHLYDPPWYSIGLLHKGHMSSAPNIIPSTLPKQKHQNACASGQSFCKSLCFLTVSNSCSPN